MAINEITSTLKPAGPGAHLIMSTRLPESVNKWLKLIQFWVLPPTCILCRQHADTSQDLCSGCAASLPRLTRPCRRCALPLPPGYHSGLYCGTCLACPPPYTRLLAPWSYRPPLPSLVAAFKYQSRLVNGRVLAAGISALVQQEYHADMRPTLLVPVPLHGRRLQRRGFNQSLELAHWMSQQLAIPVTHSLVTRVRHTPQQTGLSAAERKRNLSGAFRIRKGFRFKPGTTVAIVDDVVTTGTTVTALAKVLLRAGADEVHVWAIARTCT